MKVLIIDDIQHRHKVLGKKYAGHDVHHSYNYTDTVQLLQSHVFDLISFDHDLECYVDNLEKTGASIARFMADNGMKCGSAVIHSQNPVGGRNIDSILRSGDVCLDIVIQPFDFPAGMRFVK